MPTIYEMPGEYDSEDCIDDTDDYMNDVEFCSDNNINETTKSDACQNDTTDTKEGIQI